MMKKHFEKELVMNSSTKFWICDNSFVKGDAKVSDHCHITRIYSEPADRDCNINVSLSYKFVFMFHNLKNYDAYLIMLELIKFDFKTNVVQTGLQTCISFNLDNKLVFIYSIRLVSSLLGSLVKKLGENNFKHLRQEFNNAVLDLVKQKWFYPYEHMCNLETFF